MTSVQIITDTQELVEATKEFARFLKWDWFVSSIKIAPRYEDYDHNFIIAGEDKTISDKRNLFQQIRKRNPLQPLVYIGGEVSDQAKAELDIFNPVYFCQWPFNSMDFVSVLIAADQESTKTRKLARKLKSIFKLLDQRKGDEAQKVVDSLKKHLTPYLYQILMARCLYSSNKHSEALSVANEASLLRPDSSEALELIAKITDALGKKDDALALLESKEKVINEDMDCLVLLGNLALESGDLKKSKKAFQRALEKDKNDKSAQEGAMAVSIISGEIKSVTSDKGAMETSMKLARVCNEKAIALVKSERYRLAEYLYNNTIELLPDKSIEFKLLMNLGLCMKKAGNLEVALKYFLKGKEKAPPNYIRFDEQIAFLKSHLDK